MYKLLVADDEQIVLDSIKFIVEKNFKDSIVIETARSGRQVIEKAEYMKPDIVFMDINMPGINGIEAIKEIKSSYSNTVFVIITAYEQFDFAKEAVKLGVVEYLLKPVSRNKIVETVNKVIGIINSEREKRKKELVMKEKLESVLPILENGFIYSIVLFDDNKNELERYGEIFEISENSGYIMTVEFGEMEKHGGLGNRIGLSVKSQSFYEYFRNLLKGVCKCIIGPVMLNRIVVFIPSDADGDEYSQRLEALNIADYIYNKFNEKVEADFYIGLGRTYTGLHNMSRSYEESLKAIRSADGKGIVHIMDVPTEYGIGTEYPLAKEKLFLEKASAGETEVCLQHFGFLFDWLITEYLNSVHDIKNKLIELMVLLHRLACDYGVYEGESFKQIKYLEEFLAIEDISVVRNWCRERIEYITRSINHIREKRVNSLILKAKSYIDLNYDKEITLEDVSREVNISPHYFSRLFKEETGENFIEYLTLVRIQKAKEFLEQGQYSVKEICYLVGYGDPNYFSRIFKKVVGVTPTDYKETIQNK